MGKTQWEFLVLFTIVYTLHISSSYTNGTGTEAVPEEVTIIDEITTIVEDLGTDGTTKVAQSPTTQVPYFLFCIYFFIYFFYLYVLLRIKIKSQYMYMITEDYHKLQKKNMLFFYIISIASDYFQ